MVYRSYKDWRLAGFIVVKGEKSSARTNNGEALFSDSQVTKLSVGTSKCMQNKHSSGGIAFCSEGFNGHYYNEDYIDAMY